MYIGVWGVGSSQGGMIEAIDEEEGEGGLRRLGELEDVLQSGSRQVGVYIGRCEAVCPTGMEARQGERSRGRERRRTRRMDEDG